MTLEVPPGRRWEGVEHVGPILFKGPNFSVDAPPASFTAGYFNAPLLVSQGEVIVTTSLINTKEAYLGVLETTGTTQARISAKQILWLNECALQAPPGLEAKLVEASAILKGQLVRIGILRGRGRIAASTAFVVSMGADSSIEFDMGASSTLRIGVLPSQAHVKFPPGHVEILYSDKPPAYLPRNVKVINRWLPESESKRQQETGLFFAKHPGYLDALTLRKKALSLQTVQEVASDTKKQSYRSPLRRRR